MGMVRKLGDVGQALTLLKEQGKIEGFLNNVGNAGKLGDLIDDIRDAMMEYQACVYRSSISDTSNVRIRPRYNKISTKTVVSSL